MKHILFIALALTLSTSAFAGKNNHARKISSSGEVKCSATEGEGMDPEYIEKQAENAKSCGEAARAVESCGFGSSQDVHTCGAAVATCEKFTKKLGASDRNLKKLMLARCAKTCNQETDGTLCRATQAFCRLDVVKFMYTVNAEGN